MANIEKRVTKDGRRVYKFRCLVGKDARGKQKFEYTTWKPPEGLTVAKEKKLAEAEAYRWEQELKHGGVATGGEYTTPLPEAQDGVQSANIIPDEETFRYFAEEIWMPLKVVGGGLRPSTISMYGFMLKVMIPKLGDKRLTEISGVDIMRYLQYLRDEYKAPDGRTLSEKSVKHHFNILRNIFNYAERQEYGVKSETRLEEEINYNMAYKWFCGLALQRRRRMQRPSARTGAGDSATTISRKKYSTKSFVSASRKDWYDHWQS